MFRRVIVATVTMFFQQWTGINAILYYAPKIFSGLGLSSNAVSLLATGVVGITMFLVSLERISLEQTFTIPTGYDSSRHVRGQAWPKTCAYRGSVGNGKLSPDHCWYLRRI